MSVKATSVTVTVEYTCPSTGSSASITGDSTQIWTTTDECDCCGITVERFIDVRKCRECGESHEIQF